MKNLRLTRMLAGIKQVDLSQLSGIPNYRICNLENGRAEPEPEELAALAEALGTTVEEIEGDYDDGRKS